MAYIDQQIDIVTWTGETQPLGQYQARIYLVDCDNQQLEQLAQVLDEGPDTWLFSYPDYGPYATPVPVLIQQDRARLTSLREKLNASS